MNYMVEVEEKNDTSKEIQQFNEGNTISKKRKKIITGLTIAVLFVAIAIAMLVYFFQIPIVNINGKIEENVGVGEEYIDKGINAYTKFRSINDKVVVEGKVDTSKLGQYTIKYKVPFSGSYNYRRGSWPS